ncbi:MAG TPA: poly-gamma-glutamate hydrolase family protein [Acidimicrobiales bacterium]|nr:poly-gamma-glutamate hydrolase family protein [Acidimicrobiales bacterium]
MFADLLAHDGVREIATLRSRFGFMAFHGGSLEKGTDDIAARAAELAGASLYAVVQPPDLRWHVPSTEVDPEASPALASFLEHVDTVVAVHGYGRPGMFTTILLGGGNRELAREMGARLRPALPDYQVVDDLDAVPTELRGLHPDNPVNRARLSGAQLELPPRVRGLGPFWAGTAARRRGERQPHTRSLIDALADTARAWADR